MLLGSFWKLGTEVEQCSPATIVQKRKVFEVLQMFTERRTKLKKNLDVFSLALGNIQPTGYFSERWPGFSCRNYEFHGEKELMPH